METVKGFFDYCISDKCVTSGNFETVARRLIELGYRTIAINQVFGDSDLEPKKKKRKGEVRDVDNIVPPPLEVGAIEGCEELKVLNRLTIVFSSQDVMNKVLKSPNYKKYHVVAIQPMSQAAFQFTCSSIEADILTYDPENKPDFKINRKLYKQLVEKRFFFELLYSPAIQDSTQRKNVISMSHLYHSYGNSKNIIISSGATNSFLLRSPYDIVNLGFIFGLSQGRAKNAIGSLGRDVYIKGVGRRHGKVIMLMKDTLMEVDDSSTSEEEDETDQLNTK